ncbi:MAG: J domain-containing protein, partial [candidate division Zixibacteria bacterium]|nr:J domain-containing protein [candidate division Zixibacteria bacterium]
IVLETAISFATAAVGDTIVVPTLNGQAKLKIPAGTQSGKVLKLRGMGIEHLHHRGKGDQLVRVMVWVPTKLSVNDKRILEELARSESFEPPAADKSFFEKLRETLGV